MLISVIIPIYNAQDTITTCLDCILNQTYAQFEILCIDDGSADASGSICQACESKDRRVRYLKKENGGPASARNYGVKHCKGDYILFVDSDDSIKATMLQLMMERANQANAEVVLCGFNLYQDEKLASVKAGVDFIGSKERFIKEEFHTLYFDFLINAPWNKLIKTSLIREHDIVFRNDLMFLEDLLFSLEVIKCANHISVIDEVLYNYYYFRPGALTTQYREKTGEAILLVAEKLEECLEGYEVYMPCYYADIVHKTLVHLRTVRVYDKYTWKEKRKVEYRTITNPKFQYYLKMSHSRKIVFTVKKLILKYIICIIKMFEKSRWDMSRGKR